MVVLPSFLGVDAFPILFKHRSFQSPIAVSPETLIYFFWKDSDPWKEWGEVSP